MRKLLASIEAEYRRYKALGEGAIAQLPDDHLAAAGGPSGNSIIRIVWHVSGNLESRFTDFLTSDGEKPWRDRDQEFLDRSVPRANLLAKWERGFDVLFGTLADLDDAQLDRVVRIRSIELPVYAALHRSLAHTSYHVGQVVFLAKALRADDWRYLSIPPGESARYNRDPTAEQPPPEPER